MTFHLSVNHSHNNGHQTKFTNCESTISTEKTKVLVVGKDAEAQASNAVNTFTTDNLEVVPQIRRLGSMFTSSNTLDAEVHHRIAMTSLAVAESQSVHRCGLVTVYYVQSRY